MRCVWTIDRYRVVEPMYEGIRVILSYRGEPYSPAYIQGLSGAAFRVAGICPCAPTCSTAMDPRSLIRLLGYAFEECSLFGADRSAGWWFICARVTTARWGSTSFCASV